MGRYICTTCQYVGRPARELRGSGALELILLLFGVLPGIAYGIWRHRGPILLCPRCHHHVVPVESPEGLALLASRPNLPSDGFSDLEQAARIVRAFPLMGGVGFVALMVASIAFPGIREQPWLIWLVYAIALLILAHSVWLAIHLLLGAAGRRKV